VVPGRTDDPALIRQGPNNSNLSLTYDKGPLAVRYAVTHNDAYIYVYNYQAGADLGPFGPNGDDYSYAHTQMDLQGSYRVNHGLTLTGSGDGSIAGIIGTTTGTLTKNGGGTWTLLGANTYTGATNINAGVLNVQNATALGTTAGGTMVNDNAKLQIQGGITVGSEALTISGVQGSLESVNGINNYGGLVTLGAANGGFFPTHSFISSDAGSTLNLTNTGTITGAGSALDLQGAGTGTISSILGMTSSSLTKDGAGTWTLSGANTYTNQTNIYDGTLKLSGVGNLGNTSNGLLMDGAGGGGFGSPILDLNGTLRVETEPGAGTRVVFELPIAPGGDATG
jgi:autotransporter-associated beta strand protein